MMGSVDFTLMLALLIGSIPGIITGSLLGGRAGDSVLRPVLAITLLVVRSDDGVSRFHADACASDRFDPRDHHRQPPGRSRRRLCSSSSARDHAAGRPI